MKVPIGSELCLNDPVKAEKARGGQRQPPKAAASPATQEDLLISNDDFPFRFDAPPFSPFPYPGVPFSTKWCQEQRHQQTPLYLVIPHFSEKSNPTLLLKSSPCTE